MALIVGSIELWTLVAVRVEIGVLGVNLALLLLYESTGFVAMTYKQPSQAASPSSLLSSFLCPHPVLTESRSQLLLPLHNILTSSLTQLVNVESFSY